MTDTITTNIKKIGDLMAPSPITQHLGLGCGLAVLGRGDMIDNRLDLGAIKHAILIPPDQISNGNRRGDFMAENPVDIQNLGAGEWLIAQMTIEYFFC